MGNPPRLRISGVPMGPVIEANTFLTHARCAVRLVSMTSKLSRQVVMRLDEETWARVEATMRRMGLSQSAAIRMLLLRALEAGGRGERDNERDGDAASR